MGAKYKLPLLTSISRLLRRTTGWSEGVALGQLQCCNVLHFVARLFGIIVGNGIRSVSELMVLFPSGLVSQGMSLCQLQGISHDGRSRKNDEARWT